MLWIRNQTNKERREGREAAALDKRVGKQSKLLILKWQEVKSEVTNAAQLNWQSRTATATTIEIPINKHTHTHIHFHVCVFLTGLRSVHFWYAITVCFSRPPSPPAPTLSICEEPTKREICKSVWKWVKLPTVSQLTFRCCDKVAPASPTGIGRVRSRSGACIKIERDCACKNLHMHAGSCV